MPAVPLTKTLIDALAPRDKPYETSDSKTGGLKVRVEKSGRKTYLYSYRIKGRRTTLTIGPTTHYTLPQARDAACRAAGEVAAGGDPHVERRTARRESDAKRLARRESPTLRTFMLGAYRNDKRLRRLKGAERVAEYPNLLRPLDGSRLCDIRPEHVVRWRDTALAGDLKPDTVNRRLEELRSCLSFAVRSGLLDESPADGVKKCDTRDSGAERVRWLDEDEAVRLRGALTARDARKRSDRASRNRWCAERHTPPLPALEGDQYGDHLTPLVLLALNTGCRRGELFRLTWSDIRLNDAESFLIVRAENAKSRKARTVDLNREAAEVLTRWRRHPATTRSDLIFPSPKTGKPLTTIQKSWSALLKTAEITDCRFHDCRHDFAASLRRKGADIAVISDLLGHHDIAQTMKYAHVHRDTTRATVALLDDR